MLGAVLALIAVVVTISEQERQRGADLALTVPTEAAMPTPEPLRAAAAVDVRLGPGDSFAVIGSLAGGEAVEVIGRDFGSEWLAIRFPLGTASRGWVPAIGVEGITVASVSALTVLLPTPVPTVVSTPRPVFSDSGPGGVFVPAPAATAATATPLPRPRADLDVQTVRLLSDGRVSMTLVNHGPGGLSGQLLVISVRAPGLNEELLYFAGALGPGEATILRTEAFRLTQAAHVQVVLDPSGSIDDPNRANNVRTEFLTPAFIQPTPTPTPRVLS